MYRHETFVQCDDNAGAIRRGLIMSATAAEYDSLTVAVAYATAQGCRMLTEDFRESIPNWNQLEKRWLISFDFGITEPGALNHLSELPNSEVRVPNALRVIQQRLRPSVRFHPKLYLFDGVGHSLFSGSANLTPSGLVRNQEQGVFQAWTPPFSRGNTRSLRSLTEQKRLIDIEYEKSELLTDDLLERYTVARNRYRQRTPYVPDDPNFERQIADPLQGLALSKAALLATSPSFWVEVGNVVQNLGANRPGNQIDLQRGSRVFFGFDARTVAQNTSLGEVSIRFNNEVTQCHMRFGNNSMDKLTLPIPNHPGPRTYENTTLKFDRDTDGIFDLTVGNAQRKRVWREQSQLVNGLYQMVGGREFGVF